MPNHFFAQCTLMACAPASVGAGVLGRGAVMSPRQAFPGCSEAFWAFPATSPPVQLSLTFPDGKLEQEHACMERQSAARLDKESLCDRRRQSGSGSWTCQGCRLDARLCRVMRAQGERVPGLSRAPPLSCTETMAFSVSVLSRSVKSQFYFSSPLNEPKGAFCDPPLSTELQFCCQGSSPETLGSYWARFAGPRFPQ